MRRAPAGGAAPAEGVGGWGAGHQHPPGPGAAAPGVAGGAGAAPGGWGAAQPAGPDPRLAKRPGGLEKTY